MSQNQPDSVLKPASPARHCSGCAPFIFIDCPGKRRSSNRSFPRGQKRVAELREDLRAGRNFWSAPLLFLLPFPWKLRPVCRPHLDTGPVARISVRRGVGQRRRLSTPFHKYDHVCCVDFRFWRGATREHPPQWGCDRGATKPEPKSDATLRATVLFGPDVVAHSLQTPEGYARRSRLVWAENPSPQTWAYL